MTADLSLYLVYSRKQINKPMNVLQLLFELQKILKVTSLRLHFLRSVYMTIESKTEFTSTFVLELFKLLEMGTTCMREYCLQIV